MKNKTVCVVLTAIIALFSSKRDVMDMNGLMLENHGQIYQTLMNAENENSSVGSIDQIPVSRKDEHSFANSDEADEITESKYQAVYKFSSLYQ